MTRLEANSIHAPRVRLVRFHPPAASEFQGFAQCFAAYLKKANWQGG